MKPGIVRLIIVPVAGIALACAGGKPGAPGSAGSSADSVETAEAVRSANELGFRLYRSLAAREGNFIFSPAGVSLAIAQAQAVGPESTAPAVSALLGMSPTVFQEALGAVIDSLEARASEGWAAPRTHLWKATELKAVPTWANEKMPVPAGLLPDPAAPPGAERLLAQITGVRGHWLMPFLSSQTLPGTFLVSADSSRDVGLVRTVDAYRLKVIPRSRMVEIPYVGLEASLLIFHPDTTFALAGVEAALNPDSLNTWVAALPVRHVDLSLPRITVSYRLEADDLAALGLQGLFPPGGPSAFWSAAFLNLDQDGSLVTGVSPKAAERLGATTSIYYHRIQSNRPFPFVVRENRTGLLLLMGPVVEPPA